MATDDSSTLATGLYEPLLPPYQVLTSTNRGPLLLLTAVTLFILTALVVVVKMRIIWSNFRKLRSDDIAMNIAVAFALVYTITICNSVQQGLGRVQTELDGSQVEKLSQSYYAANISLVFALASTKASVALLVISFKPKESVQLGLYGILIATALWCVTSVFLVSLQCGPSRWTLGPDRTETCINQYAMQVAIKTIDMFIDVTLVILPAWMMSKVQVSLHKRLVVMALFGLRIATPIFTAISLRSFSAFYTASLVDRPSAAVNPAIWTTVALNLSIVTACVPSIKRFLADWAAGLSIAGISDPFEQQHVSGGKSSGGTYGVGSVLRSTGNKHTKSHTDAAVGLQDTYSYYTRRGKGDNNDDDNESTKALNNGIIMQTIDYAVEYEDDENSRDASPSTREREGNTGNTKLDRISKAN